MFSNCIERLGHKKKTKTKTKHSNNKQTKKNRYIYITKLIKTVVETFLDDVYLVMTTI